MFLFLFFFLAIRHHDGQETEKILVLFLNFGIQVFQELILELLIVIGHDCVESREIEREQWEHTKMKFP